jgi:Ca2+-binding EF-hand superfamily protein
MRSRNLTLSLLFFSLALGASAQGNAQKSQKSQNPQAQKNPYVERFRQLDLNHDGYVSSTEWPMDRTSFGQVDRDKDGRLSQTELLTPNQIRRDPRDEQFRLLDLNHDGHLSQSELQRGVPGVARMDRNADGIVTRREYENTWNTRATVRDQRRFQSLDRNHDNRLSRPEWNGGVATFDRLDRNRDGALSPDEWPGR